MKHNALPLSPTDALCALDGVTLIDTHIIIGLATRLLERANDDTLRAGLKEIIETANGLREHAAETAARFDASFA